MPWSEEARVCAGAYARPSNWNLPLAARRALFSRSEGVESIGDAMRRQDEGGVTPCQGRNGQGSPIIRIDLLRKDAAWKCALGGPHQYVGRLLHLGRRPRAQRPPVCDRQRAEDPRIAGDVLQILRDLEVVVVLVSGDAANLCFHRQP